MNTSARAIARRALTESSSDGPTPVISTKDINLRSYYRYTVNGPTFRPVGDVTLTESLPAGAYHVRQDMSGVFLEAVVTKTDDLMKFEDSSLNAVVEEIDKFWDRKQRYSDLKLMHNRGIIMYGPPGTGKSCVLQQVVEMMTKRGEIVIFTQNAGSIPEVVTAVRQVEPERKILVSFEEADELASYDERTLLRLLDGDLKISGVCYLATTNYINRLSERLRRPGRFDKLVYIKPPTFEHRKAYLTKKLSGMAEEAVIIDIAKKTEGMGFGHLRELIAGAFALGEPVDEVILRLKDRVSTLSESKSRTAPKNLERMISRIKAVANRHDIFESRLVKEDDENLGIIQRLGKALSKSASWRKAVQDALTRADVTSIEELCSSHPETAKDLAAAARRMYSATGMEESELPASGFEPDHVYSYTAPDGKVHKIGFGVLAINDGENPSHDSPGESESLDIEGFYVQDESGEWTRFEDLNQMAVHLKTTEKSLFSAHGSEEEKFLSRTAKEYRESLTLKSKRIVSRLVENALRPTR